jgi:hypothetical protein
MPCSSLPAIGPAVAAPAAAAQPPGESSALRVVGPLRLPNLDGIGWPAPAGCKPRIKAVAARLRAGPNLSGNR